MFASPRPGKILVTCKRSGKAGREAPVALRERSKAMRPMVEWHKRRSKAMRPMVGWRKRRSKITKPLVARHSADRQGKTAAHFP